MKTKALISFAVTAKLIWAFVFAYADCWFSHEAAQMRKISKFIIIFTTKETSIWAWFRIYRKFCIFFSSVNTSICEGLGHCKLTQDTYPSCIWKKDDEYNSTEVSYFFPTPTPKPPPTPPQAVTTTVKTGKLLIWLHNLIHRDNQCD